MSAKADLKHLRLRKRWQELGDNLKSQEGQIFAELLGLTQPLTDAERHQLEEAERKAT